MAISEYIALIAIFSCGLLLGFKIKTYIDSTKEFVRPTESWPSTSQDSL